MAFCLTGEGLFGILRVRKPGRKSKIRIDDFGYGAVGALQATFEAHPDIKLELERRILKVCINISKLGAHNRSNVSHTRWFLHKLRKLGYEERGEWPFNPHTSAKSQYPRHDCIIHCSGTSLTHHFLLL